MADRARGRPVWPHQTRPPAATNLNVDQEPNEAGFVIDLGFDIDTAGDRPGCP